MAHQQWEYAVLTVRIIEMSESEWTWEAKAWLDETEIYSRIVTEMYWSAPLADLGRDGWELVGAVSENALLPSWIEGWETPTSRPVQTDFFFKRPLVS